MKKLKIVVAPDSFKGSLSAQAVAECISRSILSVCPQAEVCVIPMADGGEGTVDVIAYGSLMHKAICTVANPLMLPVKATYAISADGKRAVMEIAAASGLTLIDKEKRNPLITTSYGTGQMISDALDRGCRNIYVGLGGSATNDAGMGMLRAFGYRFYDADGHELLGMGKDLCLVENIDVSSVDTRLQYTNFTAACDVGNPLYGKRGAAYIFAPQKGATPEMVQTLDRGLYHFSEVAKRQLNYHISNIPGAGAAGGLGATFASFLGAHLCSGVEMVLKAVDFDRKIEGATMLITGEGQADRQSLMGKVLSGLSARCRIRRIPVVSLAGCVKDTEMLARAGVKAIAVTPHSMPLAEAMKPSTAIKNITRATTQLMHCVMRTYLS